MNADPTEYVRRYVGRSVDALAEHFNRHTDDVIAAADRIARCLSAGGKVLFFGNGGSAADAQHLAAELVGRYLKDRPALAACALTTDTSALTAIANDYGYDRVFERQVRGMGRAGDVAFGISTSGNSPNVLKALHAARELGLTTVGLAGRDGGAMPALCDLCLVVRCDETPIIQQVHITIGHLICDLVERTMFPEKA